MEKPFITVQVEAVKSHDSVRQSSGRDLGVTDGIAAARLAVTLPRKVGFQPAFSTVTLQRWPSSPGRQHSQTCRRPGDDAARKAASNAQ